MLTAWLDGPSAVAATSTTSSQLLEPPKARGSSMGSYDVSLEPIKVRTTTASDADDDQTHRFEPEGVQKSVYIGFQR